MLLTGGDDLKILRYGVCTSFLENALRPWLQPTAVTMAAEPATLRIFHKPSISFRLPGSINHPLILVRVKLRINMCAHFKTDKECFPLYFLRTNKYNASQNCNLLVEDRSGHGCGSISWIPGPSRASEGAARRGRR